MYYGTSSITYCTALEQTCRLRPLSGSLEQNIYFSKLLVPALKAVYFYFTCTFIRVLNLALEIYSCVHSSTTKSIE